MLFSFTGPSGVGKGYLKGEVKKAFPELWELVWLTTRPLRPEEVEGRANRASVPIEEFAELRMKGDFVYEQTLYGHSYALSFRELDKLRDGHGVTEFHIDTLASVRKYMPGLPLVSIGLVTDDIDLLRERLYHTRQPAPGEDVEQRLRAVLRESEKIRKRSGEFSFMIEVAKSNESTLHQTVISFLAQHINKRSMP